MTDTIFGKDPIAKAAKFGKPRWLSHVDFEKIRSPGGFELSAVVWKNLVALDSEID